MHLFILVCVCVWWRGGGGGGLVKDLEGARGLEVRRYFFLRTRHLTLLEGLKYNDRGHFSLK